jgi:hypothetical protein
MKGIKVMAATTAVAMMIVAPSLDAGAAKKRKRKPKPPKPVTVMVDPAGDAGSTNGTANQALPGATEAGLDLTKGIIFQKGKNLLFTAQHAAMPESGTLPEGFRMVWGILVDGTIYQLTVKSLDVGKPDVMATVLLQDPQGEERVGTVYQGVARLEQCGTEETPAIRFSKCEVLSYNDATFDAAKKTVSFQIPMKDVKAKRGSVIIGGGQLADTGCFICWVPHYGERSLTPTTVIDNGTPTKPYKVG